MANTCWCCLCLNSTSFSASVSSCIASCAIANNAALAAPASPMAKVATGMPFGICTIDNKESWPLRYFDGTGTPRTGMVVFAANIPGRCAAPPAPAIMQHKPLVFAVTA